MPRETLLGFILRHRFKLHDVAGGISISRDEFKLFKYFPPHDLLRRHLQSEEQRGLSFALALGSYMAECDTDDHEIFAKCSSMLNDEQWRFALRFCPYHNVAVNLDNLALIQSAMDEAYLGLNTALAGMEVAIGGRISNPYAHDLEISKATSNLLNFTALYATYVDNCRRIRKLVGMKEHGSYDRAISRLTATYSGQHRFIQDYRNFQLHYQIVEPYIVSKLGPTRISNLYLSANELLYSGYCWKKTARSFLESDAQLDVIDTVAVVLTDVKRLIRFHRNLVERRLRHEKHAYDTYRHERNRHNHLLSSMVDVGAIFKQPKMLIERLLDRNFVEQVLDSALSEDEIFKMLINMADRHRNLPKDAKKMLELEVRHRIAKRPKCPSPGAYLQGRLHE